MRRLPLHAPHGEAHHHTKGLVRVTMACNERCPFCNVPVEDYAQPVPSDEEVQREIDDFVQSGERTLTISGGEPTLMRKRLLAVITEARGRGVPFVELQTNAILIDADYAVALAEAGLTSGFVSLLSDVPELHDELAGLSGAFERCLAGIDALLDVGIAVTLNPVVARATQERVAAYVDFVKQRLPRVTSISLSAVQPHGRGAKNLDLMPDYDVLAGSVREAQARAADNGVLLLNPYCGLPLCVGWEEAPDRCIEAIEAREGAARAHGIDNAGNKRHGEPCYGCAWRTRCGGAWHAYWDERGGRGIAPPDAVRSPWDSTDDDRLHSFVVSQRGATPQAATSLREAQTPVVWLVAEELQSGDATRLFEAGCTDVAVMADVQSHLAGSTLSELVALAERNSGRPQQRQVRAVVVVSRLGSFANAWQLLTRVSAIPDVAVHLLHAGDARRERFLRAAREELGGMRITATAS